MASGRVDTSIRELAERYAAALRREMTLGGLYVYGSYARGTADPDSDIDTAVISDNFTGDCIDDMVWLMRLRRKVDTRIEPRAFTPDQFANGDPLVRDIMSSGVQIV